MQGAISSIDAVERWFRSNEAPFFTLSYYSSSSATGQGQVILRNLKDSDINQVWERLKTTIIDQTGFGRAQLNLIVYTKPEGSNTPSGRTNIDLVSSPSYNQGQVVGIGSLPAVGSGYISESDFERRLKEEKNTWEMRSELASLRDQIDNPANDPVERIMGAFERIAATPLGMALVAKFTGAPIPQFSQVPINGPANVAQSAEDEDFEAELDDLEAIATKNGMTLKQLLAKTAHLAHSQPGMVSMLAHQ